jgi:hypothetical protein
MIEIELPLLSEAMASQVPAAYNKGLCFHWSAALCLDLEDSELVIGTLRAATDAEREANPDWSPEPFTHCWVEYHGMLLAPTTIPTVGRLVPFDPAEYYAKNGVSLVKRLNRERLMGLNYVRQRDGRLFFAPHLGGLLCDAAGYAYRASDRGTVLPA